MKTIAIYLEEQSNEFENIVRVKGIIKLVKKGEKVILSVRYYNKFESDSHKPLEKIS